MGLTVRLYRDESDYDRIRVFLQAVFLLNGRRQLCWQPARLDYWRWHVIQNCGACLPLEKVTYLWESRDQLAAVVHPEVCGEAFFQVHPSFLTKIFLHELVEFAETHLAVPDTGKNPRLSTWIRTDHPCRREVLEERGWHRRGLIEQQRRKSLLEPLPRPPEIPGICIRPMHGEKEIPQRSWASWRAFHPERPKQEYQGYEWYRNILRMPLYRPDLDLVAVTPDGSIAAFCTVWYDPVTRTAYLEPIGRDPNYARRHLSRAVLLHAVRRARNAGADLVTVAGRNPPANILYASVAGSAYTPNQLWIWP